MSAARVGSLVLISCGAIKSLSGRRRPSPMAARTGAPTPRRKAMPARAARRPATRNQSSNVAPARAQLLDFTYRHAMEARCGRHDFFHGRTIAESLAVPAWGIALSVKFLSGLLTAAQQAGGEETIEAGKPRLGSGKMRRQCAQFAVFVQDFGQIANLARFYRNPHDAGIAAKKSRNLRFAFFGFNRTSAIDDHSAGLHQFDGFVEQACLKRRQRHDIARFFDPGDIRMTPDRPRGETWRIDQNRIERPRLKVYDIGNDDAGPQIEPGKICGELFQPLGRTVYRRDIRAGRELRCLASGSGAKIGHLGTGSNP